MDTTKGITEDHAVALLLSCARADLELATPDAVGAAAARVNDWQRVRELIGQHGLLPMIHAQLLPAARDQIPTDLQQWLEDSYRENAVHALGMTQELLRLLSRFTEAGVPVLFFKGPVLAQQLYGQVARREFLDLDLLVPPAHAAAGAKVLRSMGYEPQYHLTPEAMERYLQLRSELAWEHPARGVTVDYHWALLPLGYSFSDKSEATWASTTTVPIASRAVSTLSLDTLLGFFVAHHTKHNWSYLVWIVDFAALLRQMEPERWPRILAQAEASGSPRMLRLGLALVEHLFGFPLPSIATDWWQQDPSVSPLAREVMERLWWTPAGNQHDRIFRATLDSRKDRWWYWWTLIGQPTPLEWNLVSLPGGLRWLYYPIRWGRLLVRRIQWKSTQN